MQRRVLGCYTAIRGFHGRKWTRLHPVAPPVTSCAMVLNSARNSCSFSSCMRAASLIDRSSCAAASLQTARFLWQARSASATLLPPQTLLCASAGLQLAACERSVFEMVCSSLSIPRSAAACESSTAVSSRISAAAEASLGEGFPCGGLAGACACAAPFCAEAKLSST